MRRRGPTGRLWPARTGTAARYIRRSPRGEQPAGRSYHHRDRGAMRVVIAEDLYLLRDGLTRLLDAHGFDVTAAVGTAPELLSALLDQRPDVAVIDVRLPPTFTDEGPPTAPEARRQGPGLPGLLLSQYVEQLYARELLSDLAGGGRFLLQDPGFRDEAFVEALPAGATVR